MGQTGSKPTAQGQVESSINDTINFIMAKVAAGEIDAATATELIAAARKDYESNVPVTASAQQAVQPQQSANTYQANPQTAYAVPEMEPEQTPVDYGQFATPTNYPHTVTDMVVHDMKAMQDNIGALDGMKLGDGNAIVIGKCPKCGKDLYATKNQFRCAGVHFKKTGEKDGKAVFAQDGTCDFSIYRFVGPKDKPKKLTDKNGREIAEKGKTSLIKGIKKKSGDGTYDAYLTLNRETWSLDMKFPEFKGKKHKG